MQKSHFTNTFQLPSLTSDSAQKSALPNAKAKMSFNYLCWLSDTADKEILVKIRAGQGKTAQPYPAEGQQQLFRL